MYGEPPINPPEVRECLDCSGSGEIIDHAGPLGPIVARVQWCDTCGGHGIIEPQPGGGWDTWKEAEGIA